ncbi:hypothetical protein DVH24_033419 [Malus domestica]|uniref:Uncharacterized protein n=1 Tax=Malus domestica TaxID=3750 RepID=A0A498JFB6_MALDO|nr:hypothetical protein DVH24_033419 [Malus domestica]
MTRLPHQGLKFDSQDGKLVRAILSYGFGTGWVGWSCHSGRDGSHVAFERERDREEWGRKITSKFGFGLFRDFVSNLHLIGSALIIDDSTFTKDSANPKTNKGKARPPLPFIRFHGRMSNEVTLMHARGFLNLLSRLKKRRMELSKISNSRKEKDKKGMMANMKRALVRGCAAAALNNDRGQITRLLEECMQVISCVKMHA